MNRLLTPLLAVIVLAASAPAYAQLRFRANLSGAQEVAEVATEAAGTVRARFDRGFTKGHVVLKVRDGVGVTRAHFHCNRPGANSPIAFGLFDPGPLFFDGTTAEGDLTNADFTGADCVPEVARSVNNIAALAFAMRDGLIYVNVHSSAFPGGEIRGQLLEVGDRPGRGNRDRNRRDDRGRNGRDDDDDD